MCCLSGNDHNFDSLIRHYAVSGGVYEWQHTRKCVIIEKRNFFTVSLMLEKCWEQNIDVHHLFVDF